MSESPNLASFPQRVGGAEEVDAVLNELFRHALDFEVKGNQ